MRYEAIDEKKVDGVYCVVVQIKCPACKLSRVVNFPEDQWTQWQQGSLIQNAFPSMSPADREGLMTGYCDPCFKKFFAEGDDDAYVQ